MADAAKKLKKRRLSQQNCNDRLNNQSDFEQIDSKSQYFKSVCDNLKFKKRREENFKSIEKLEAESAPEDGSRNPIALTLGSGKRLSRTFYDSPAVELAKNLLGKLIYHKLEDGEVLSGLIVETEGYLGENDKASHSYGGKRTSRTEPMFMLPGTAYVYFIYGMHFCLNISSRDTGGAVLIRALEPVQGIEKMKEFRGKKRQNSSKGIKDFDLCNGPSKLCQAIGITKDNTNKKDMVSSNAVWIEDDTRHLEEDFKIVTTTRIGVNSYGQDAALQPLRFYILGNRCVSVRDKKAEESLN